MRRVRVPAIATGTAVALAFSAAAVAGTANVGLISFTASKPTKVTKAKPLRTVTVRWRTGSEPDTLGFNLYREVAAKPTKLNRAVILSKGATAGATYSFVDRVPKTVKTNPCYRLEVVGTTGTKAFIKRTCAAKK